MLLIWTRLTIKSVYNEIFGEPVDHPILIRGLAFCIDLGLFFLLGHLIYQTLGLLDFLSQELLLLLNILLWTTYFTFAGSNIFKGQSLGKRIFGLRVVDVNCNYLGIGRSFIRSIPIVFSINGYGIMYFLITEHNNFVFVCYSILTTLFFGILYFFIFKLSRQGLHDIIVRSQVIPKDRLVTVESKTSFILILGYLIFLGASLTYVWLTMSERIVVS
jgi:uncharacterized RDD family membrane protein YckC